MCLLAARRSTFLVKNFCPQNQFKKMQVHPNFCALQFSARKTGSLPGRNPTSRAKIFGAKTHLQKKLEMLRCWEAKFKFRFQPEKSSNDFTLTKGPSRSNGTCTLNCNEFSMMLYVKLFGLYYMPVLPVIPLK